MTLASSAPPGQAAKSRNVRLAAVLNMLLGALALASITLATHPQAALWSAGFVGLGLLVWGGVQAWAASSEHLRGTKLLAMFMAILGVILAGHSLVLPENGTYRAVTILLGLLVVALSVVNAFLSPDEDRRGAYEPRRRDDLAP